jgi:hypothetical protein
VYARDSDGWIPFVAGRVVPLLGSSEQLMAARARRTKPSAQLITYLAGAWSSTTQHTALVAQLRTCVPGLTYYVVNLVIIMRSLSSSSHVRQL